MEKKSEKGRETITIHIDLRYYIIQLCLTLASNLYSSLRKAREGNLCTETDFVVNRTKKKKIRV